MTDALVFIALHETAQWREAAAKQKLEITNLTAGQVPGGEVFGTRLEFGGVLWVELKVDQFAAMWGDQVAVRMWIIYVHDT